MLASSCWLTIPVPWAPVYKVPQSLLGVGGGSLRKGEIKRSESSNWKTGGCFLIRVITSHSPRLTYEPLIPLVLELWEKSSRSLRYTAQGAPFVIRLLSILYIQTGRSRGFTSSRGSRTWVNRVCCFCVFRVRSSTRYPSPNTSSVHRPPT